MTPAIDKLKQDARWPRDMGPRAMAAWARYFRPDLYPAVMRELRAQGYQPVLRLMASDTEWLNDCDDLPMWEVL